MDALNTFDTALFSRLLIAAVIGFFFGLERDLHGKTAGLRTSMLICIGACLFTLISIHGFPGAGLDPSRVASQIVVGIGFIGAGVMLKNETHVYGLTTAANIWMVAAIGMALATDLYVLGIAAAVLALILLVVLRPLSKKFEKIGNEFARKRGEKIVHED